jgi:phosphoribosylamine--glycine ligase
LLAAARGRLTEAAERRAADGPRLPTLPGAAVAVVLASAGYPEAPRRDDPISGLGMADSHGALVFHAGTRLGPDGAYRTHGGRVLAVVGRGPDLSAARARANEAAEAIVFDGQQRRHDIGADPTVAPDPRLPVGAASASRSSSSPHGAGT